jgi:hypothetical protein
MSNLLGATEKITLIHFSVTRDSTQNPTWIEGTEATMQTAYPSMPSACRFPSFNCPAGRRRRPFYSSFDWLDYGLYQF